MTASRSFYPAVISLAASGLLAVMCFPGCALQREYVRRGLLLDSINLQLQRIEQQQQLQYKELIQSRAEVLTLIEQLENRIGEVDAELGDIEDRIERIGRRLGAWQGTLLADSLNSQPAITKADSSVARLDPDVIYNTAYLDFTRTNYQVAITGFRRFIQLFPSSDLADNAQYWIGECFYSLNQLDSALTEFNRVREKYPDGNKVPAALYKMGLIYQLLGKGALAKAKFEEIVSGFPDSPEAKLAQERLKNWR
uniref:Tol-pal system protein YbgF n=1 Tax=candidate division WOR-3 bacterium TaxID=2052148 RepID=A0A7C1NBS5_UNCW3